MYLLLCCFDSRRTSISYCAIYKCPINAAFAACATKCSWNYAICHSITIACNFIAAVHSSDIRELLICIRSSALPSWISCWLRLPALVLIPQSSLLLKFAPSLHGNLAAVEFTLVFNASLLRLFSSRLTSVTPTEVVKFPVSVDWKDEVPDW